MGASPDFSCSAGGSLPFSRGCYKQKFSVPAGDDFVDVKIPFNTFSDKRSSATGEQTTTCADDADVCPTAAKLAKIQMIEFWGEGASGSSSGSAISQRRKCLWREVCVGVSCQLL